MIRHISGLIIMKNKVVGVFYNWEIRSENV